MPHRAPGSAARGAMDRRTAVELGAPPRQPRRVPRRRQRRTERGQAMSGRSVEHATFVVERKYEASPERAFAPCADPTAKARWFVGSDAHLELDFRVGGREYHQGSAP